MCGIFGAVDFEAMPVELGRLKNIGSVLSRRGPDEEGIFMQHDTQVSCAMVHRRLKVIDLSSGKQPMANETGDVILACNGEIYNYKELRSGLIAQGHVFRSNSDSEVILHAYEEYSYDCLKYLRGMFAFCIWDKKNNSLFLARDRLGKKPLYYYLPNDLKLIFSSEIRAIMAFGEVKPEVNNKAIHQYLSYCYIPAPETAFKSIYSLLPAEYIIFSHKGLFRKKYWDIDFSRKISISEDKAAEEVSRLVHESVALRMISDVPVGVFLSGGLDSSVVTGVMSQKSRVPIETFSIGFDDTDLNEIPYVRITQRHFNCAANELIIKPDAFERLPDLIECFGQPHADSSALATMLLAEEAKKKITVALVGEGADELFGGYKRHWYYRFGAVLNKLKLLPRSLLRQRYKKWLGGFTDTLGTKIFSDDFLHSVESNDADLELFNLFREAGRLNDIDAALYVDTKFFLPYDLLTKLDVATMAYGLEARAPFLDHKLMEFAASLPPDIKLKRGTHKFILRKAFKTMLPPEIARRKKTGFVMPVQQWLRGELHDAARSILLSSRACSRGYFKEDSIKEVLDQHLNGEKKLGHEIWALLVFELWMKRFIDKRI